MGMINQARTAAYQAFERVMTDNMNSVVDSRDFDLSDLPDLVRRLKKESETAQVLIISSYLEDLVRQLMVYQLADVGTETKRDTVFGSNGPLSTFGSRLTMCHQLNWLSSRSMTNITSFKKIRNEFAHRAYKATYADKNIKAWFRPLEDSLADFWRGIAPTLDDQKSLRAIDQLDDRERKICSMAVMVTYTSLDLLLRPEALKRGIGFDVWAGDGARPKLLDEIIHTMLTSVFTVLHEDAA